MDLVEFLIVSLAVWRIVNAIYDDSQAGPFNLLHRFRHAIGIRYDRQSRKATVASPRWKVELAEMHSCTYCMSVWYGTAAAIAWYLTPASFRPVLVALATPLAISAAIIVIQKIARKPYGS